MNDRQLSPHFSLLQLTETNQIDLQEENRHVTDAEEHKLSEVANLLEAARSVLGCDLDIHSGRRYLALNKRVGGSERSQHLKCEAADFSPVGPDTEESIAIAHDKLVAAARQHKFKFGQLIVESDKNSREGRVYWIHLSLGSPYRDPSRCGEVFKMDDGKRTSPMIYVSQETA